jgi:PAS domain S-box-containing protein
MAKRSSMVVSEVIRRWFGGDRDAAPGPSKHLFERFMRHLPGMAWLKDLSGKFVYANDATGKAFGVPADQLLGKGNVDFMPPEIARQCDASDQDSVHTDGGLRVVEKYVDADGNERSVLVSKFRIAGEGDAPTLIGGIAVDITDRLEAETQLQRSEERLRLATKTGKVGVWNWDLATNRFEWTGSLFAIHGIDPRDFDGRIETIASLYHPDDIEALKTTVQNALAGQSPYEVEYRAIRPDGSVVWLYTNGEVVFENGKPVRVVGATLDITNRKQTELALRESEERFAKAFNASPLLLALTSLRTGKLVEVNDTFCRLTGYSREEALGRTTVELGLWANLSDREDELRRLESGEGVRNLEYRLRTRDGREIIGLVSADRVLIQGEPHALTVIQDITDRSLALRALHLNEQRMRLALRGANAGAWVYADDASAAYWSSEFRNLFGFGPDVPSSLDNLAQRIHPDDRQRVLDQFIRMLRLGEGEFRQEFRILHPQLGLRWMLTLGRVDREDGVVNCHGISLDISRLKLVEDELRLQDQRKNEFLATLAHELRNPLAPIRNGLEILRLTPSDGEMAQQARAMMERQLRQMVRLIDDLLDLSRISRGKIELKREHVELAPIVQAAVESSRPLIEQAHHRLTLELAAEKLCVDADATRLAQVFANLLNNAAKYTNNGGHIRVVLRREGDTAIVCVEDNGIGIPAEMLPKVFDMFTQVDRSLEKAQGGLGVGLSIAKQLVEMHGGTISASSAGPDKGSEFTVRLPLVAAESPCVEHDHATVGAAVSGLRILVADDNLDAANSLAMMLRLNGNDVVTACDGFEAIETARTFRPHAILLDIGMPRLNGYDACRQLRAIESLGGCLIVATTGWGQDDDVRRSKEAGFDYHLVKPVEARVIQELLQREFAAGRRSLS